MPAFPVCPTVCNANMSVNILASFNFTDNTRQIDTTCNGVLFLTDDPGLNILSNVLSGGWLTTAAGNRTRIIGSLSEIAAHYGVTSPTYRAARDFFANVGQRGVTSQFILGFWDEAGAETITTALNAINNCNGCWTHIAMVHLKKTGLTTLMDGAAAVTLAGWAQANEKIAFLMSVDILNETAGSNDLANQLKTAGYTDAFVVYGGKGQCVYKTDAAGAILYFAAAAPVTDADGAVVTDPATGVQALSDGTTPRMERYVPYVEFITAGWIASVDMSQSESGYDIANKPQGGLGWVGVEPTIITNGALTAVTGRNLDGTINPAAAGHANAYVKNEGQLGMQFGMTAGGLWIDQIHLRIYLRRRVKDALTSLFANSRRLPYDDARGQQLLANAVASVMAQMQAVGHFVGDAVKWEDFGPYVRKGVGWVVRQDAFSAQTSDRKNARIAPALSICYVPAGATNFVPVTLCTLAVPTAA